MLTKRDLQAVNRALVKRARNIFFKESKNLLDLEKFVGCFILNLQKDGFQNSDLENALSFFQTQTDRLDLTDHNFIKSIKDRREATKAIQRVATRFNIRPPQSKFF